MQRKVAVAQPTATTLRLSRQSGRDGASANKVSSQVTHEPAPRPHWPTIKLGTASLQPPGVQPLMTSAISGGTAALADGAAPASSSPPAARGPSTAELERPVSTRPPVPSASLRRLRTISDLHALVEPANQLPVPSKSAPDLLVAGPTAVMSRPQASSNVVPGPSSRSAAARAASAPDDLSCATEAAEEPAACTGVTVFCMMPLDTVRHPPRACDLRHITLASSGFCVICPLKFYTVF